MGTGPTQYRNAFPAFKIFVFGLDVTKDVLSCNISYNDGRSPNLAEIQLENKFDKYVITETDILKIYDDVDPEKIQFPSRIEQIKGARDSASLAFGLITATNELLEQAKVNQDYQTSVGRAQDAIDEKVIKRIVQGNKRITPNEKAQVIAAKVTRRRKVEMPPPDDTGTTTSTGSIRDISALSGEALVYPFQVGDSIFHSSDPVRIFWRDPFNPRVWYHMFAGFVTDTVDYVNENNVKVVTLRIEDPTRILRYARIATNPSIVDINAVAEVEDVVLRTFQKDNFVDLTLTELLYTLIFGDEVAGTTPRFSFTRVTKSGAERADDVHIFGVGNFRFSESATVLFGTELREAENSRRDKRLVSYRLAQRVIDTDVNLADYQAFIDHQVKQSDLQTMLLEGEDLEVTLPRGNDGKFKIEDVIDFIGSNPHLYPVDNGRLIILAPKSLGPNTNREILLRDIMGNIALRTSFKTRLAIIYDIAERLEFSFYASPKGDLIFEMPLYDFMPDDFGKIDIPTVRADFKNHRFEAQEGDLEFRGPFREKFIIGKRDTIDWTRTFTEEHVRTQYRTTYHNIQGWTSAGEADVYSQPSVVTLKSLVPLFGLRMETAPPRGYMHTRESANYFANIKLNQWNADSRSAQVNILPRVQLWLNRPIEFEERNYVATSRSINHNLVWNSDMTSSIGVNYIRGWAGQVDVATNRPIYEPLGGFASRPLNYAVLFNLINPPESTKSGPGDPEVPEGEEGPIQPDFGLDIDI